MLTLAAPPAVPGTAQVRGVDPEAARILRRMTDHVGGLRDFGLDAANTVEVVLTSGQKIQYTSASRTTVQRPTKLRADRIGDVLAPAGDFIAEDAHRRLMAAATSGFVVGKSVIDGVRCDHLAFRGPDIDWQIWIEDGDRPLPRKYVITTLDVFRWS